MRTDLYQFAVVGGDLRQWYLADILASKGHGVLAYGLCKDEKIENVKYVSSVKELIQEAEVLVYPIPFLSPNRMSGAELKERKEMLSCLRKGQIFFAGCIPRTVMQQMESQKVRVFDLMEDHCLAVENSVATAEGMIAEAMIRSPKNLRGSRCLILGYGVCGRMLASYLKGIRCEVGVVDKSQTACACARADGIYVVETDRFLQEMKTADIIFNTIPERILSAKQLSYVRKSAWILDIASGDGGVDYAAARKMGVQAVKLPGLPGKYAPYTSARIIADTIFQKLRESVAQ